jgi:antitoxin VapB
MDKAKVFWSGRSQAVRLPKKYRFDTEEVTIRREGNMVVLEPKAASGEDPWAWLDKMPGELDQDFVDALNEPDPPLQERPELHKFFK